MSCKHCSVFTMATELSAISCSSFVFSSRVSRIRVFTAAFTSMLACWDSRLMRVTAMSPSLQKRPAVSSRPWVRWRSSLAAAKTRSRRTSASPGRGPSRSDSDPTMASSAAFDTSGKTQARSLPWKVSKRRQDRSKRSACLFCWTSFTISALALSKASNISYPTSICSVNCLCPSESKLASCSRASWSWSWRRSCSGLSARKARRRFAKASGNCWCSCSRCKRKRHWPTCVSMRSVLSMRPCKARVRASVPLTLFLRRSCALLPAVPLRLPWALALKLWLPPDVRCCNT
mmetsp:Transcript_92735/g.198793  ORF Transcript_92735/g.198793 Transcript_92735/m.198793 type:complete len:289 (-) Transcript_92735:358-1224(-)